MEKKKRKLNGLDLYVIFSISALIVYTIVTQVMLFKYVQVSDTLTTCFFGFFGSVTERIVMAATVPAKSLFCDIYDTQPPSFAAHSFLYITADRTGTAMHGAIHMCASSDRGL